MVKLLMQHPNMTRECINTPSRDHYTRTALKSAIVLRMPQIVKILVNDERTDINLVDEYQATPLIKAIVMNEQESALLLINSTKHNVDWKNYKTDGYYSYSNGYKTALSLAIAVGMKDIVKAIENRMLKDSRRSIKVI